MIQINGELKREKKWKVDLLPSGSGQFAIDGGSLFIWRGPNTLARLDCETGKQVWSAAVPGNVSIGTPTSNGGLLLAATADVAVVDNGGQIITQLVSGRLSVLDAETGTVLWTITTPAVPTGSPILLANSILLPTDKGVYRLSICGGAEEWHANIGQVVQPLLIDAEKIVVVTKDGSLHVLSLADGQPWRLKDGSTVRAGRPVPTVRRVAPTSQVDKAVTPVLAGDRVIFGGLKPDTNPPETDLMVLTLPEPFEPSAAAPSSQPDESPEKDKPVEELVCVEPKTWCETGFLGPISQPLVLVEGQVYTAIKDLGLVCFGKRK
jgi:hypothetical protein